MKSLFYPMPMMVNTKNLKPGQRLASRVTKKIYEDFVNDDTDEVFQVERNLLIAERGTRLTPELIRQIAQAGISKVTIF